VRRLGVPAAALAAPLATLTAAGELLATGEGEHAHYLHARAVAELEARIAAQVGAAPDGLPREELRTQLPAALPARAFDAVLAGLERRGQLVTDGERVRKAAAPARAALSPAEAQIAAQFKAWALEPPRPKEVPAALGLPEAQVRPVLERLIAGKQLVKIKPDLFLHADVVADLRARLIAFLDAHKTITAQQWKDLTGASRKYTIPFAEYFDAEKLTLRVGEIRRRR
jgi:selenocysteine-specific elongation factor